MNVLAMDRHELARIVDRIEAAQPWMTVLGIFPAAPWRAVVRRMDDQVEIVKPVCLAAVEPTADPNQRSVVPVIERAGRLRIDLDVAAMVDVDGEEEIREVGEGADSDEGDHPVRRKASTQSDRSRSPSPSDGDHSGRSVATLVQITSPMAAPSSSSSVSSSSIPLSA